MKQSEIPPCAPWLRAAMPMLLAASLSGCATPSAPVQVVCPANLPAPALQEPMPQETYSASAQRLIRSWREQLTPTPQMPAH